MRIKIALGAIFLALIFSNTAHTQDWSASFHVCEEHPSSIEETLQRGRELVSLLPTPHAKSTAVYREVRIGENKTTFPGKTQRDFTWRTIPLALLDTRTGEMKVTTITRQIVNGKVPTLILSDDGEFLVAVEERVYGAIWNWWNTPLIVVAPEEWSVIAINWKRSPSNEHIAYTPFSLKLVSTFPEIVLSGEEHLEEDLQEALVLLSDTPSRVLPNTSIAELITMYLPHLVSTIVAIEHGDDFEFKQFKLGIAPFNPLLRAAAIIGANGDGAFSATKSTAGARGVMQIMPKTCATVRSRYPQAHIPAGCTTGGHSHPVEIASAFLVVDYHLSILAEKVPVLSLVGRSDLLDIVLVSYNGGPGRALKGIRNKNLSGSARAETRGYLIKAEAVSARK